MRVILPGRPLFGPHQFGVFAFFDRFQPGLVLDVGASNGAFTKRALGASPVSHAIAFEPLPAHWPELEKRLVGLNARIVKAAVADRPGTARFDIGKSNGLPFYGGFLSDAGAIEVPVTTIDEHASERVMFLKIDVQGGEMNVLRGATRAFERGIDLLHVEFTAGDDSVLAFLLDRDYYVYDHRYALIPRRDADLSAWDVVGEFRLSTGGRAVHAWPKSTPSDPSEFCAMFTEQDAKVGRVITDLVATRVALS